MRDELVEAFGQGRVGLGPRGQLLQTLRQLGGDRGAGCQFRDERLQFLEPVGERRVELRAPCQLVHRRAQRCERGKGAVEPGRDEPQAFPDGVVRLRARRQLGNSGLQLGQVAARGGGLDDRGDHGEPLGELTGAGLQRRERLLDPLRHAFHLVGGRAERALQLGHPAERRLEMLCERRDPPVERLQRLGPDRLGCAALHLGEQRLRCSDAPGQVGDRVVEAPHVDAVVARDVIAVRRSGGGLRTRGLRERPRQQRDRSVRVGPLLGQGARKLQARDRARLHEHLPEGLPRTVGDLEGRRQLLLAHEPVGEQDVRDRGPRLHGGDGLLAHAGQASPERRATPVSRGETAAVPTRAISERALLRSSLDSGSGGAAERQSRLPGCRSTPASSGSVSRRRS